jgi:PiT family inorganic phosphate transporter
VENVPGAAPSSAADDWRVSYWLAVSFALAFALTNGFHDAANAIATLVATRGARPGQAVVLSAAFIMLGALLVGTAVADTIAGVVVVEGPSAVPVIGAGALAAVVWNLLTWSRGLPSSSGHALVGGLVGAALAEGGVDAVRWGGLDGWRPVGVFGVLIALAVAPVAGLALGLAAVRTARRLLRRATRAVRHPIRGAEWAMTSALSFSQGANDAQKSMGVIAALLLAAGRADTVAVPRWAAVGCGAALAVGTSLGGWRIVRTIGRRIFHLDALDGLASQTGSATVILGSSYLGAPVSTTHVVASSVVGVGAGRRRWRHIRWGLVRSIGLAWLLTLPASGLLGAAISTVWRALG